MTETELEYQFCFNCNDRKQCYTKPKDCTRIQEEIGLQEMTNEEYLRSCTTEQLAEFIADVCYGLLDDVWSNDGDTSCDYRETEKNYWVEWLKQPHGGES